jgi:hypothetical protein
MSIEDRVARLEGRVDAIGTPATKADLTEARLEISRDIANLATGVAGDLRAIRVDIAELRTMRQDLAEIRRLLERRSRWWPF